MVKKSILFIAVLLVCTVLVSCRTTDFRVTPIVEGQPATHEGYNVGPDLYLYIGDPAKVTGLNIYISGLEPDIEE